MWCVIAASDFIDKIFRLTSNMRVSANIEQLIGHLVKAMMGTIDFIQTGFTVMPSVVEK